MDINRRVIALVIFAAVSIVGFMVKLPRVFHHHDKELHAAFYFLGFLFLTYLFPRRWILIAFLMGFFGIAIEYAQEFSNKVTLRLIGKRIHGRFDIEDVEFNLLGLFFGVVLFLIIKNVFQPRENKTD
jgi:VanZ family protein